MFSFHVAFTWFFMTSKAADKGQFSFQFQRKAMPKNVQTTAQVH